VVKFHGATPISAKVLEAHMLHFKPISPFAKKFVGKPSSLLGRALAKLGHFVARVKIWGTALPEAKIWPSKKVNLVGKH